MTTIQTILLSVVEGITEFLPISSTGHLVIAGKLLGVTEENFTKSFDIAIQLGAILAVVVLYWKKVVTNTEIWKKVLVAFVPTAIVGFFMYKLLKTVLLSSASTVIWALFWGGVAILLFEWWYKEKDKKSALPLEKMSYKQAFFVGLFQSLAVVPGVSRSAATIIGGLAMDIKREAIVEFSFLLAVPTMAAATGYDLLKSGAEFSSADISLLALGFVISFAVAFLSVKWLLGFIQKHSFVWFGWYRIVAALLFFFLVIR